MPRRIGGIFIGKLWRYCEMVSPIFMPVWWNGALTKRLRRPLSNLAEQGISCGVGQYGRKISDDILCPTQRY